MTVFYKDFQTSAGSKILFFQHAVNNERILSCDIRNSTQCA